MLKHYHSERVRKDCFKFSLGETGDYYAQGLLSLVDADYYAVRSSNNNNRSGRSLRIYRWFGANWSLERNFNVGINFG